MMTSIKRLLQRYGIYCFLLPVFFALHSYIQYYGLVSGAVTFKLLAEIEVIFLVVFLLLLAITRHANRSLQVTALLGFIALFYGVIKDFFKVTLHTPFMARYIVLLPVLAVLTVFLIILILKKKDFKRANLFQNLLLLLFIVTDGILLLRFGGPGFLQKTMLTKNNIVNTDSLAVPANRPDVYYLVFDSYPGTGFLRDYVQYDNTPFDTALQSRGFHVIAHPKSNYNRTAFSICSTLNFEYLSNIDTTTSPEPKHYNQAILSVQHGTVPTAFAHWGYKLYNLSIFDWPGNPSIHRESFLAAPEEQVLLYNTLSARVKSDILWNFIVGKFSRNVPEKEIHATEERFLAWATGKRDFTNKAIDSLLKIPALPAAAPKFIYAHLYLPHPPFFYDSIGKSNDRTLEQINRDMEDKAALVSYIKYTNKVILKLVDSILLHQRTPPVIIVQSDHGYRDLGQKEVDPHLYFNNYSAFYFPRKDYSDLYDGFSNINTFPFVFNKYFNTHIPLQKDSVVFTTYPD